MDDITLREEKRKQKAAKLSKQEKGLHRAKFNFVMGHEDYSKIIEHHGFQVIYMYNPPGNGNCQFAAVVHQLNTLGIFRSPETMRDEIVDYLQNNPVDNDGFPLLQHLIDSEFPSWQEYLQYMARKNTFGDQLTLFAAANLYNINIQIVSTLRHNMSSIHHRASLLLPFISVILPKIMWNIM